MEVESTTGARTWTKGSSLQDRSDRKLSALSSLYEFLTDQNAAPVNPVKGVELPGLFISDRRGFTFIAVHLGALDRSPITGTNPCCPAKVALRHPDIRRLKQILATIRVARNSSLRRQRPLSLACRKDAGV